MEEKKEGGRRTSFERVLDTIWLARRVTADVYT